MNSKQILFFCAFCFSTLYAQQKQTDLLSLKINGKDYTQEFKELESNPKDSLPSINSFIDLKLKLDEGKALGLDTTQSFLNEYGSYREDAIKRYMTDTTEVEAVAKTSYDRLQKNIELSHIAIAFPKNGYFPADTLAAYTKALAIRERLVKKNPEDFSTVAGETSDDAKSKFEKNPGSLGWQTALIFDPNFEDAMYSTKVNTVSMPIRSSFGYHLIKVTNTRSDLGLFRVTQLMLDYPNQNPTPEQLQKIQFKIDSIYQQLTNGADFDEMCKKYSTDKETLKKGELGWISISTPIPQEFKRATLALQNIGDISKPVQTMYGFHIIKLLERKSNPSWEKSKDGLEKYLARDLSRAALIQKMEIQKLGLALDYKQNKPNFTALMKFANSYFPKDSVFQSKIRNDKRPLFSIREKQFTFADFATYLSTDKSKSSRLSCDAMQEAYNRFLYMKLKGIQKDELDTTYPELKKTSEKYYNGILLYDVMDKEVWSKAEKDTVGLSNYFEANRSKYKWNEPHYKGYEIRCKNKKTLNRVKEIVAEKKDPTLIFDELTRLKNDTTFGVRAEMGLWHKGENETVDHEIFNVKEVPQNASAFPLVFIQGKLLDAPENYKDVQGLVINDYQLEVEKQWLKSLRAKYPVTIETKH